MRLIIEGKCPSKKNSRTTIAAGKSKAGKTKLLPGKSKRLRAYEEHATMQLRAQWNRSPLKGDVRIAIIYYFSGVRPDALGFSETIFDVLEYACVVENDVQLIPSGNPAIARVHVATGEEKVLINLSQGEESS